MFLGLWAPAKPTKFWSDRELPPNFLGDFGEKHGPVGALAAAKQPHWRIPRRIRTLIHPAPLRHIEKLRLGSDRTAWITAKISIATPAQGDFRARALILSRQRAFRSDSAGNRLGGRNSLPGCAGARATADRYSGVKCAGEILFVQPGDHRIRRVHVPAHFRGTGESDLAPWARQKHDIM